MSSQPVRRSRCPLIYALSFTLLCLAAQLEAAPASRDFTFLFSSDPHIGSEAPKENSPVTREQVMEKARWSTSNMLQVAALPCPALDELAKRQGPHPPPSWFIIAGDLTDNLAWPLFETVFPQEGLSDGKMPLFLCVGNHDGPAEGAVRTGAIARNRAREKRQELSGISSNGLHYAWTSNGVHLVCVNLCPADGIDADTPFKYGKPGPGTWNDPAGALEFLTNYLRKNASEGQPVIIWQHYGYCEGFNFDWNWWSAKQRRAFYDAVKPYNIVALLHGHTHASAHYQWPDAESSPQEVERLFGKEVPPDLRSFHVFSGGSIAAGSFYLFRVTSDQLVATHYDGRKWSSKHELNVAIPLSRTRR